MNLQPLDNQPRLLIEARLAPMQGNRFQPTGFPDLGAAVFTRPDGTEMILVESSQSMANRLEAVCWDEANNSLVSPLKGLPYIEIKLNNNGVSTNSILEAHRINSPYFLDKAYTTEDGQNLTDLIITQSDYDRKKPINLKKFASTLLRYDPNSIIHGVFLSNVGDGRLRLARMLSAFIEAENVRQAASGGVKLDRIDPQGDTKKGFGHVPFPRIEYTADKITAYFNLDLQGIRSLGLGETAYRLLVTLALFKIQKLLHEGLRLRTACDLDVVEINVTRPTGFTLPPLTDIEQELPRLISQAKTDGLFNEPPVTTLERR